MKHKFITNNNPTFSVSLLLAVAVLLGAFVPAWRTGIVSWGRRG